MSRKNRHTTEQIVNKLRQADVELAKGQSISAGVTSLAATIVDIPIGISHWICMQVPRDLRE